MLLGVKNHEIFMAKQKNGKKIFSNQAPDQRKSFI